MATAFQADAFQNNAFQIDVGAPAAVIQQSQMGGSGGWIPAHQIRWGKQNKKRPEQVEEVVAAIAQVAKAYPEFVPDEADERRHIAIRLLADRTINKLRQIEQASALLQLIEDEIERDDEEIFLLM